MGGTGTVKLTIDASALDSPVAHLPGDEPEFLSDFWFNFSGDATQLTFGNFMGPPQSGLEPAWARRVLGTTALPWIRCSSRTAMASSTSS